jgi:hypothetical protein
MVMTSFSSFNILADSAPPCGPTPARRSGGIASLAGAPSIPRFEKEFSARSAEMMMMN